MQLTGKLLGFLNRVFDKDAGAFVGLRLRHPASLTWSVADGVLTVTAGGVTHTADLSSYTLASLAALASSWPGVTASALDPERSGLSALVLLDGSGDQAQSNGDALMGYTSVLWAIFEAFARQLQDLATAAGQAPLQLTTKTAAGVWLDELGSYYGVARLAGEADAQYGPRIIAEAVRPIANNVALERAIQDYTGQPVEVVDVTVYAGVAPLYDGSIHYDGTAHYNATAVPHYGLFDVTVAYDLIAGGDISTFLATVTGIVDRLRAAGTHMRSLALSSAASPIVDDFTAPTDEFADLAITVGLAETMTAPNETFGGISGNLVGLADALAAPSDAADGTVYQVMRTASGEVMTDSSGNPLQANVGPLFV